MLLRSPLRHLPLLLHRLPLVLVVQPVHSSRNRSRTKLGHQNSAPDNGLVATVMTCRCASIVLSIAHQLVQQQRPCALCKLSSIRSGRIHVDCCLNLVATVLGLDRRRHCADMLTTWQSDPIKQRLASLTTPFIAQDELQRQREFVLVCLKE
jgi:hypothetical protein